MHASAREVRRPVAAGSFYPDDPRQLREVVRHLLDDVPGRPVRARAAIVPHAGYAFSGRCATHVYARIEIPDTVVLIGPNHFHRGRDPGAANLWCTGAFATPLGEVRIDEAFAAELLEACPLAVHDPIAHAEDHALEVQLPFILARASPRAPAIVPVLLAWDEWGPCRELAAALACVAGARGPDGVLLLASSDMTHFEPAADAMRHDAPALEAIQALDGGRLLRVCREQDITMCGAAPAAVVIEAARRLRATRATVVDHSHSGMATGDISSVVSYAGVVIT